MKVIHFISSFDTGGAEAVIGELIKGYPAGIESGIVTFRSTGKSENILRILKKDVFKYIRFLRCIQKLRPDVVHAHMSPSFPYLFMLRLFNAKIKVVYTVHSEYRKPTAWLLKKLNKWIFERGKISVVCVSSFVEKSIAACWNVKGTVIYNGIQPKSVVPYSMPEDMRCSGDRKFVTIARVVPVKNLLLMVSAFARITKEQASLFIIGYDPTPEQNELKKIKKAAGDNVFFLGKKDNTADYLALADAYCCSSLSEAMPVSVIESLSLGIPVLSTPAGGIPEMISNNENGLIAENFSEEKYVEMLQMFLSMSSEDVVKMKHNARTVYRSTFTADRMVEQYMKVYSND